ncbi:hypothetical protein EJB05_46938 [Eragrostis curvula]|uniref:Uncharacterized protein n=1 Tax=Eragrostis curvula TaxID=38414 RepID=A0A5J9T6E2_9POAL|nr:hypothetical protein EJB05_46938 [Eragrostis curvula]
MSELRQIAANLRPLSDRFGVQLPREPQILARDVVSPSRGVEAAQGSSLACDEVPANTFVMTAQAVEPFVATANRIRLPQVKDELVLHGGDTLYKSLLFSQVKSLAITHASLRQYRELSQMKADRDSLRKNLSVLETKVKEKEEALVLSEKCLAELSSKKETLSKSAADFKAKVDSLDKQVEELDAALAKARNDNEDLRGKVDVADQEFAALVEAERLRLSSVCGQVRDALVSVGTTPEQLPGDASIEHYQAWLLTNIPYVVRACRTFSNNAMHLAVRDLLHSLEAGGSDALAKAVSDSFSLVSTDITPPSWSKLSSSFLTILMSLSGAEFLRLAGNLRVCNNQLPEAIPSHGSRTREATAGAREGGADYDSAGSALDASSSSSFGKHHGGRTNWRTRVGRLPQHG